MSLRDKQVINVLNYNESVVTVSAKNQEFAFSPAEDGNPSIIPLSFPEIEFINSNSAAFKSGLLRFPEDIEEEAYKELRNNDWKSILTNEQIIEILTTPTIDGLQKIIDVKSPSTFERIRGIFTRLKNSGDENVSIRVEKIIQKRYKELCNRQIKTDILLVEKDTVQPVPVSADEVSSLREQLAQMQEMMATMMKSKSVEDDAPVATEPKKAVGRPAKSNK